MASLKAAGAKHQIERPSWNLHEPFESCRRQTSTRVECHMLRKQLVLNTQSSATLYMEPSMAPWKAEGSKHPLSATYEPAWPLKSFQFHPLESTEKQEENATHLNGRHGNSRLYSEIEILGSSRNAHDRTISSMSK